MACRLPALLLLALVAACGEAPETELPWQGGAGAEQWASSEIDCTDDSDCGEGESCRQGMCQPALCSDGGVALAAPLGASQIYARDLEVVLARERVAELVESPTNGQAGSAKGELAATDVIVDVATADFGDAASLVIATVNDVELRSMTGANTTFTVPIAPFRVAAALLDEPTVSVLSSDGVMAICPVGGQCTTTKLGSQGIDLASAEFIDSPSFVAVTHSNGDYALWSTGTGANDTQSVRLTAEPIAITAGDVDGDLNDDIILLEDGGYFGFADDRVVVYRYSFPALIEVASVKVQADSMDIAAGDVDGDGRAEIVVLSQSGASTMLVLQGSSLVAAAGEWRTSIGAHRVAFVDADGDSVRAELVDGPEVVTGKPVVTAAVSFPPYHRDLSRGLPSVNVGQFESDAEFLGDSIKVKAGAEVGVSANLPGIFKARMSAKVSRSLSAGVGGGYWNTIGARATISARPDIFGDHYGVVLLSTTCYAAFTYSVVDSSNMLEVDGEEFVVLVPTGGEVSLWSSQRYNQLARARGDLPEIEVTTQLGNLRSYPSVPTSIDGRALSSDEVVFADAPVLVVSDVASLGWSLSAGQYEVRAQASAVTVSSKAAVSMSGFTFGASLGEGLGDSATVILGESVTFRGATPPMPDNPSTPEDDYADNAFSFSPVVYRHGYVGADGADTGFFALGYTVGAIER